MSRGFELGHREYVAGGRRRTSRSWWIAFDIDARTIRRNLKTKDRKAAQLKAADIMRRETGRAMGLPGFAAPEQVRPFKIVDLYLADLERRGKVPRYVSTVKMQLARMLRDPEGGHEVERLASVTPASLTRNLEGLPSAQTADAYLGAARRFFRWAIKRGTWSTNPAERVERANPREQVRPRRPLTRQEVAKLLAATPAYRRLVYLVALHTGLRRSELGALRWGDVDLTRRWIRVRRATSKSGRDDSLPFPEALAEELRHPAGAPKRRPDPKPRADEGLLVFPTIPSTEQLRANLETAGVPYSTADGVADFHAFRTTLGTELALANVPPALHQRRMRHSRIETTMAYYVKVGPADLGATAEAVTWGAPKPETKMRRRAVA